MKCELSAKECKAAIIAAEITGYPARRLTVDHEGVIVPNGPALVVDGKLSCDLPMKLAAEEVNQKYILFWNQIERATETLTTERTKFNTLEPSAERAAAAMIYAGSRMSEMATRNGIDEFSIAMPVNIRLRPALTDFREGEFGMGNRQWKYHYNLWLPPDPEDLAPNNRVAFSSFQLTMISRTGNEHDFNIPMYTVGETIEESA